MASPKTLKAGRASMGTESDVIVVGGGIIGLSSAWALCRAGLRVQVHDHSPCTQASWAGGGILSPLPPDRIEPALKPLLDESLGLYPQWCAELQAFTGIDPQFWRCGLRTPDHWFPDVAQVRSPRLLAALRAALLHKGVKLVDGAVEKILDENGRVAGVLAQGRRVNCARVVLAAGAWSARLHATAAIEPVKGEMLLLRAKPDALTHILLDEDIYLVPRRDGRVLVGSTLEHAGFDVSPTCAARVQLLRRAQVLWPAVKDCAIELHWAGLRPRTSAGLPLIGASDLKGLFLNTGHYRLGITLAPGSAQRLAHCVTQGTEATVHPQSAARLSAASSLAAVHRVDRRS